MAKTRRKKINKSPAKPFRNSKPVVIAQGSNVKVQGYRAGPGGQVAAKGDTAKPVFIGRAYTGIPRGKQYPYAGQKRGGAPFKLAPRRTVGVIE